MELLGSRPVPLFSTLVVLFLNADPVGMLIPWAQPHKPQGAIARVIMEGPGAFFEGRVSLSLV